MTIRKTIAGACALLLLAACGDSEPENEPVEQRTIGAQGEVEGGTISDAMLPLGTVRSQSEQRGDEDSPGDGASPGGEGGSADSAASSDAAASQPAPADGADGDDAG